MKVQILPRAVITWKEFVETHPVRSIALDGYVKGKPRFNREGTHVNFNHHEDVNRLATRCTASQVSMAIKGGLLSVFTPENTTVWVNDCDWDVCLALWLLHNPTRIVGTRSEPLISRIVFNTDVIGGGRDWKLVEEIGTDARTEMRAEGICAFVSYRGEEDGRFIYSIGNLSPYRGFDLPLLYQKLNQVEALQGNDVWGGSDNCGGSPRERGSSLCPQDLAKLIEEFQRNLANARFSDGSHPRKPLSTGQNKRRARLGESV